MESILLFNLYSFSAAHAAHAEQQLTNKFWKNVPEICQHAN